MKRFERTADGIEVRLTSAEQMFLGDVIPLLAGIGAPGADPAADRLNVPVYLDDPDANEEWWRLMREELDAMRRSDRGVLQRTLDSEAGLMLSTEEADAVLRVINEARLALGARFGIDVEEDHDNLSEESRQVMDYLGWIQGELILELSRSL